MKHTPGPWIVDLDFKFTSENYHNIIALDGPRSNGPGFSITGCIGIEDARLIAAAPELLEALEGLIRLKALIEYPREVSEAHVGEAMAVSNAIRKAEEAITKAKGL